MTNDKTVTMSRELAERLIRAIDEPQPSPLYAELRAILAAQVSERQEPEAWKHTMHQELGQSRSVLTDSTCNPFGVPGVDYSRGYKVTSKPLYDSPPAPVVVVLPEQCENKLVSAHYRNGWNACLDKVKELNQ